MDTSFSFAQSLQHPFLGALQAPLPAAVPEELRCQYSSKRCENRRTNKKSGGLHKFCAVHREKANRNQMRLDHRRRVLKRLAQREQRSNGASTPTSASGGSPSRRRRSSTSRADAADNDEFILHVEDDLDIDLMPLALHSPNAGPNAQSNMIVDPQDLRILEVLLFSDEDQTGSDDGDTLRVAAPARNSECFDRAASLTTTTASKKPASTWPTMTLRL